MAVGAERHHGAVLDWVPLLIGALCATLHGRRSLVLENLLLRQQLAVALRAVVTADLPERRGARRERGSNCRQIVQALRRRDAEAAARLVAEHIEPVRRSVLAHLAAGEGDGQSLEARPVAPPPSANGAADGRPPRLPAGCPGREGDALPGEPAPAGRAGRRGVQHQAVARDLVAPHQRGADPVG